MTSNLNKPGALFWIIAIVLGLLWNLYGVFLWIMDTFLMTPELMSLYTEAQQEMMNDTPSWMSIVYGIATISGLLGSILLILKKKLAVPLFALSLIMILLNFLYMWFAMNMGSIMGTVPGYVIPGVVIVVGIILYLYSKNCAKKGWLS